MARQVVVALVLVCLAVLGSVSAQAPEATPKASSTPPPTTTEAPETKSASPDNSTATEESPNTAPEFPTESAEDGTPGISPSSDSEGESSGDQVGSPPLPSILDGDTKSTPVPDATQTGSGAAASLKVSGAVAGAMAVAGFFLF
ncbi:hypothetical protein ACOSP7_001891 [Xanthoceras sorbifolium]|uniref:Uncharacterized protein n=1 Tax=Xanthoceras sorbifolium TaxID=99658 RepID=A0ABQ8IKP0_9ROSI|nr:hypothetical protein JRO89_XS01G0229500 [Xanthoceras sorbifolium]